MTKEKNWAERRNMVANVVIDLIGESGIEGVTVRDIAKHAGYSTAVTSHYFKNKHELFLFAYQESALRAADEVVDYEKKYSLQEALERFLPLDESRRKNWRVWISFWERAMHDEDFAAVQRKWNRRALNVILTLIEKTMTDKNSLNRKEVRRNAETLLTSIVGLSVLATVDSKNYPVSRLRSWLKDEILKIQNNYVS